ncbi:hypothetical protein ACQ4PT_009810 [Festuca glaucescens]
MELQRAAAAAPKTQSLAPPMEQLLASLTMSQADQSAPMTTAKLEAAIAALPGKKQRLRELFDRLVACSPMQLPFTWDDLDAHVSSLHASIPLRFLQLQALQAPRPAVSASVPAPADTRGYESIEEDEEIARNNEHASPVPVIEVEKDWEDKEVRLAPLAGEYQAGRSRTRDQELAVPMPVHAPDAGNPMFQQPYTAYQLQPELQVPRTNLPMLQQQLYVPYRQEYLAVAMQAPNANYGVPMVQQPYVAYGRPEFPQVISQAPMVNEHVLQQQYMAHHQPYYPVVPSNIGYHPVLRPQEHVTVESGIQKDTNQS